MTDEALPQTGETTVVGSTTGSFVNLVREQGVW